MSDHAVLELRTHPSSGLRWLTGLAVAFTAFMTLIAVGCVLGLLTQDVPGIDAFAATVVGAVGAYGAVVGARTTRGLREAAEPEVVARLDADGVHLHEGLGVADLPDHLGWTTVPWGWVSAVTHTTLDLRSTKTLGNDVPLEVLRFSLADDRLLDATPFDGPHLTQAARILALTPAQARTVLVGEVGATDFPGAVEWLRVRQPQVPVLSGTSLPWSNPAVPDAWPDSARVAVVGAHGRLGRLVVEVLARRDKTPPVALVRNEAHRADLERLGAEVRMVDLDQGARVLATALRGCAAVVHLAPTSPAVVVEAARHAGVERFLLVPGVWNGDEQVALAASSGLSWTAFRPTLLTDDPPTGEVALGLDVEPGAVPRADLAEVLVAAIRDEDSVGAAWQIAGAPSPG
ncbi:NAD(P)H-binding protein [Nocardioides rubriscoriae]|uniref:NAD(P)H-binding protein n=1 Tax=Nocardioides rubriscoriae TaxID=642762 RepID=UPI0011DFF925|nr:NAD(P)H-binding protein [Nocardioides rubriscoriae]